MGIFAIGDLHLSLKSNKPMDVFGSQWVNHIEKIEKAWREKIQDNDWILIAGDTSWAMKFEEAKEDLNFINHLPGKKVFLKGNHDYWWESPSRMQELFPAFHFIQNNSVVVEEIGICGAKGGLCPGSEGYTEKDEKLYRRELHRLELSLKDLPRSIEEIIVMLHYPPTNQKKDASGFTDLVKKYNVKNVIYGHLHGEHFFKDSLQGSYEGTHYHLVSADYLNFSPIKII